MQELVFVKGDPGVAVLGVDERDKFALGKVDGVEIVRLKEEGCHGVEGPLAVKVPHVGRVLDGGARVGGGVN